MANSDLARLQGSWRVVTLEVSGMKLPPPPSAIVTVTGDIFESSGMGAVYRGRMTFGEEGRRKTFTLHFDAGPEKGNANHAIYTLDGDSWTLCIDVKGGSAPADFVSTAANGYALETLERV